MKPSQPVVSIVRRGALARSEPSFVFCTFLVLGRLSLEHHSRDRLSRLLCLIANEMPIAVRLEIYGSEGS